MAFAREIVESHETQQVIDNEIAHNPQLSDFWIRIQVVSGERP